MQPGHGSSSQRCPASQAASGRFALQYMFRYPYRTSIILYNSRFYADEPMSFSLCDMPRVTLWTDRASNIYPINHGHIATKAAAIFWPLTCRPPWITNYLAIRERACQEQNETVDLGQPCSQVLRRFSLEKILVDRHHILEASWIHPVVESSIVSSKLITYQVSEGKSTPSFILRHKLPNKVICFPGPWSSFGRR